MERSPLMLTKRRNVAVTHRPTVFSSLRGFVASRHRRFISSFFLPLVLCAPPTLRADDAKDQGPALTVYSTADPATFDPQQFIAQQRAGGNPNWPWQVPGFGVVKESRKVSLKEGVTDLRFTDVAQFIDPTTVSFTDLTNPTGTAVLEQNFQFDLVSPEKLFDKYLDRDI